MRYALVIALVVAAFAPQGVANEELVGSWYPILQAGNTWVYTEESRDADVGHGIADPTVGRWTTTETVSNVELIPEGTRVTIQSRISDIVRLKGWEQDPSLTTPPLIDMLVRGNCIYRLETAKVSYPDDLWSAYDANHAWRPEFQRALARNDVPPAYCLPMKVGADWGRVPSKEDEYDIWHAAARTHATARSWRVPRRVASLGTCRRYPDPGSGRMRRVRQRPLIVGSGGS